jgi:hypothetical protein
MNNSSLTSNNLHIDKMGRRQEEYCQVESRREADVVRRMATVEGNHRRAKRNRRWRLAVERTVSVSVAESIAEDAPTGTSSYDFSGLGW